MFISHRPIADPHLIISLSICDNAASNARLFADTAGMSAAAGLSFPNTGDENPISVLSVIINYVGVVTMSK